MSDHPYDETPDAGPPQEHTAPAPTGSGPADAADTDWSTGDTRVDDAVARLDSLDERDVHEHVDVYDSVHHDLADVLDDAGTPPAPA